MKERHPAPAKRRGDARIAFFKAIAKHSKVIRRLRGICEPLPLSLVKDRTGWCRRCLHKHLPCPACTTTASFGDGARSRRSLERAVDWAKNCRLDEDWVHSWAAFAITRWEYALSCPRIEQGHRCAAARSESDVTALGLALSPDHMTWLAQSEDERTRDGNEISLSTLVEGEIAGLCRGRGIMDGPDPHRETKTEFLKRAAATYDRTETLLKRWNNWSPTPRRLDQHCEWLVRFHVHGQTAAEIVADLEGTDTSTVYKAVRSMAQVIGLPVRVDLN